MEELGGRDTLREARGSFRPAAPWFRVPQATVVLLGLSRGVRTPGQGGSLCAFCQVGA